MTDSKTSDSMLAMLGKHGSAPTAEEVADAGKTIEQLEGSAKAKMLKSKDQCLRDWAKANLSPAEAQLVKQAKGEVRRKLTLGYMAFMSKQKNATKKKEAVETQNHEKKNKTINYEENEEKMNEILGPVRAKTLRDLPRDSPNALKTKACPYTGSLEDPLRLWCFSVTIKTESNADSEAVTNLVELDATADDINMLGQGSETAAAALIQVKVEEKSPKEKLDERVKEMLQDCSNDIRTLQDMELAEACWITACGKDPMRAPLVKECLQNPAELKKTVSTLKKVHGGDEEARKNRGGLEMLCGRDSIYFYPDGVTTSRAKPGNNVKKQVILRGSHGKK